MAFGHEYEITNYQPQYLLDYREQVSGATRWDDRVVSQSGEWSGNLFDFYSLVANRLIKHFKMPFSAGRNGNHHNSRSKVTEAVNEAVANAIIHAYYGGTGKVTIILTDSELTTTNPGSLLVNEDVAISGGFSETRNPTLMRFFTLIGVSDRAGSGLQEIWQTWKDEFEDSPILEQTFSPSTVTLKLPLNHPSNNFQKYHRTSRGRRPRLDDKTLLAILSEHPEGLKVAELENLTGVSQRMLQLYLSRLHKADVIHRERSGHAYVYFT